MSDIYTKTGDTGDTSLFDGSRVKKNHIRCEAYGSIDELNSYLGLIISLCPIQSDNKINELKINLINIQHQLFPICSELATPLNSSAWEKLKNKISEEHIKQLEDSIDAMERELPELKNFIIPGGSTISSFIHIARTVCRRGERLIISLSEREQVRPEVIKYINRLSDWLFVTARWVNHILGTLDIIHK